MPFVKGKSGNPTGAGGGRKPASADINARRLVQKSLADYAMNKDPSALSKIAKRVFDDALNSPEFERQRWATDFIADRLDGKPVQANTLSDEDGAQPFTIRIIKEIAAASPDGDECKKT